MPHIRGVVVMTNFTIKTLLVAALLLTATLLGCSKPYSKQTVWQRYDFLTPVPESSGLTIHKYDRIVPYNHQIYDNDDSYVIPYGFGITGDDNSILEWNNQIN